MKSFKNYLKKLKYAFSKPKIGFGSIHKRDLEAIDPLLRQLNQGSKKKLVKEETTADDYFSHVEKKTAKPEEPKHDPFHQAYLEHKKENHLVPSSERHEKDTEDYGHHHAMNIQHEMEGPHYKNYEDELKHINEPMKYYTGAGSKHLNLHLISRHTGIRQRAYPYDPEGEHEHPLYLNAHDEALSKHTNHPVNAFKKPTILHTGSSGGMVEVLKNLKVGERLHMPAYTSTTTHHASASYFAHFESENSKRQHFMHFHLPAGYTQGRHVANVSLHPDEHEVILHKGQTFRKVGEGIEHVNMSHERMHHHFIAEDHPQTKNEL